MSHRLRSALLAFRTAAPPTPDRELLAAVRAGGDPDAFAALVRRHGPMVLGVCRRALGHAHDAEDAFQAAFVVLLRRADRVRDPDALGSWLHGVAVRVSRELVTARRRQRIAEAEWEPPAVPATDPAERAELAAAVDAAITELPARYRAAVVLCELEGRSRRDAAAALGLPEGTLSSRLAKARTLLAGRLTGKGLSAAAVGTVLAGDTAAVVPGMLAARTVRLLVGASATGALPVAVEQVASGVVSAMTISKLPAAAAVVTVLAGGLAALVVAQDRPAPPPTARTVPIKAPVRPAEPDPSLAVIRGVVVDEAGTPVAGAAVRVPGRVDRASADTTGSDGRFAVTLDGPTARYHTVYAAADGGRRLGRAEAGESALDATAEVRVVLKPAADIRVSVVAPGGAPIPGVTVFADDNYANATAATTDARGAAVLRVPADARVSWVVGLKSGVGFDYFENYQSWPPPRVRPPVPREVRLTLDGARTVRFRAVDSAGGPIPGVAFVPWYVGKPGKLSDANIAGCFRGIPGGTGPCRTDADGVAACDWFPVGGRAPFFLAGGDDRYHCPEDGLVSLATDDKPQTVRLLRQVECCGRVTTATGSPAPGVLVQAEGRGTTNHYCRQLARTGADGTYRVHLYPDQGYVIAVIDQDRAAPAVTGVVIREGQPRTDLDFRLRPGTQIMGRVTVAETGKPAARQTITLLQHGEPLPAGLAGRVRENRPDLVRWATTDADGRYRLRVGPGAFRLSGPGQKSVELTIGDEPTITHDFTAPRPKVEAVRVTVRKPDGSPAAGAIVNGDRLEGKADDKGSLETYSPQEPVLVHAHDPAGPLAGFVVLRPDADAVAIDLRPGAAVSGRVVGRDGKPRAGVSVIVLPWITADYPGQTSLMVGTVHARLAVTTGPDGTFALPGLAVGVTCHVQLSDGKKHGSATSFSVTKTGALPLGDVVVPKELE